MKSIIFIIISSLFIYNLRINGQEDSVINTKPNENDTILKKKLAPKEQFLNLNFREEKTLIKLGVSPFYFVHEDTLSGNIGLSFRLEFEKKIIPSLSFSFETEISYYSSNDALTYWEFAGDISLRYYYSMNKRIRLSMGANNFHSNYFSLKLNGIYRYNDGYFGYNDNLTRQKSWSSNPFINVSWGIQRRIGNWGFYEVAPFFSFNKYWMYYFGVNLKLGLAWGF